MDKKISDFLKKHHVLTLATTKNNTPWVAHCFYAFLEKEMCLVFTTDSDTEHGKQMLENPNVSVGIVWETKVIGQIRGMQCTGNIKKPNSSEITSSAAKIAYLKRFPYAALMKTQLWIIQIEEIKYTDNRLGFGKKLKWSRRD